MLFLFYGRDRPDSGPTRRALLQAHWDYMRPYIPAMVARGPTMSDDGHAVTGSLHIVDLPDAAAAHAFAHDDPLATGGVFESILVRRFRNVAGRTMWAFAGDPRKQRFLFVGEGVVSPGRQEDLAAAQARYLGAAERAPQIIVYGPLLEADGETWAGTAVMLEAADRTAAEALMQDDPAARRCRQRELTPWRYGGEENLRDLLA